MTEAHEKQYNIAIQRLKMPPRMQKLRVDDRGYPVPRFVADVNGKPDFRCVNTAFLTLAIRHKLCWLCGEPLGRFQCFTIGGMCAINRTSSEPPSHLECAQFAVRACPFLTQPNRARDERDLPEQREVPPGIALARNPGVTLLWVTESYRTFNVDGGILINIGEPTKVEWYARGRAATRAEIMASIEGGLPALTAMARSQGPEAVQALEVQVERGLALVPA
jgi:hypothetical protein